MLVVKHDNGITRMRESDDSLLEVEIKFMEELPEDSDAYKERMNHMILLLAGSDLPIAQMHDMCGDWLGVTPVLGGKSCTLQGLQTVCNVAATLQNKFFAKEIAKGELKICIGGYVGVYGLDDEGEDSFQYSLEEFLSRLSYHSLDMEQVDLSVIKGIPEKW